VKAEMPSQRRESVHNSNTGYRHRYREKKMFSKNEDRNRHNIKGKRPGFIELSPVVGCKPYSIKELRGFYDYHPRFISIKSNNGILSYNKLGRKTRWTSRKDRRKNSDKAGSHINFMKMYFDVDIVYDMRTDQEVELDNISNASTEEDFVV
tara:strand:- start:1953 stop:2405 length:453 start_codon:yes stop_codon:yes gene_type:complete